MSASASLSVSSSRAFQTIASAGREGPRTLLMTRSAVAGAIHSLECMPASIQIAGLDRSSPPICCHAQCTRLSLTQQRHLMGLLQLRFERDSSTIQHLTRSYVLSSNNEHVNSFALL